MSDERASNVELIRRIDSLSNAQSIREDIETEAQVQEAHTRSLEHSPPLHFLLALLAAFSIPGALIRIGLQELFKFQNVPLINVAMPQILGCFISGLTHHSPVMNEWRFMYIGLLSGLSGSITSFSTWMLASFDEFANLAESNRSVGQSFLSGLLTLFTIILVSFGSYYFGGYLIRRFHKHNQNVKAYLPPRFHFREQTWYWSSFGTALGLWVLVILLAVWANPKAWWISACFAPFGTWLRFLLSKINPMFPTFPLGTFIANLLGTLIISIAFISTFWENEPTGCLFIFSVMNGFCGCLTTVSAFIVELHSLKARNRWHYGLISIFAGQLIVFIVTGSFVWSKNVRLVNQVCS